MSDEIKVDLQGNSALINIDNSSDLFFDEEYQTSWYKFNEEYKFGLIDWYIIDPPYFYFKKVG